MIATRKPIVVVALMIGFATATVEARGPKLDREAVDDYVNQDIPEGANVWHCWYDGGFAVHCRLGEAATTPARDKPAGNARLPELVHKVWHDAAELAGSVVAIPLHTLPFDMAMTGRLANAVMCGGATQPCGIVFARSEGLLSEALRRREGALAARRLGGLALAD